MKVNRMGCRDCKRCTETKIVSIILGVPRLIWWILIFWNIGLFQKRCPQCSHLLKMHEKRADGSFRD